MRIIAYATGLLCFTVLLGLTYRWQLSGLSFDFLAGLDIRRAHSHVGFYGVLFPLVWWIYSKQNAWVPKDNWLKFYLFSSFAAAIAFVLQGYAFFSILFSTIVLLYWLAFAMKNLSTGNPWLRVAIPSIVLVAAMIFSVALLSRSQPELSAKLARCFLALLLLGVFVPSVLQSMNAWRTRWYVWFLSALAASVFLTEVHSHWLGAVGLTTYAFLLLVSAKNANTFDYRCRLMWLAIAFAFAIVGLGIVPLKYHVSVAGVHFLILGPILTSIAIHVYGDRIKIGRVLYETAVVIMTAAIFLQAWWPTAIPILQRIAAISGTVIFLVVLSSFKLLLKR